MTFLANQKWMLDFASSPKALLALTRAKNDKELTPQLQQKKSGKTIQAKEKLNGRNIQQTIKYNKNRPLT